jgi:superfamily II DNA/RNA helicase
MGRQVRALMGGVEVLVATPGRLLDLVHSNALRLAGVEYFVLDEADRMLDMGFIHDIRKVVAKLPTRRQTLLFSATMPKDIAELADTMLRDPARVAVTPVASTVDRISQRVIQVDPAGKAALLARLLGDDTVDRALVFTRTKHGADKVVKGLAKAGIAANAIHGNKSQNHRERVLAAFRSGEVRTLVATDLAARGIGVDGGSHVVNFDLPNIPDTYVHRLGRTARAGADGVAISLCAGSEDYGYLRDIERLIRVTLPREDLRSPGHSETSASLPGRPSRHDRQGPGNRKDGPAGGAKTGGKARRHRRSGTAHGKPAAVPAGNRPAAARAPQAEATAGLQGVGFLQRPSRPAHAKPQPNRNR